MSRTMTAGLIISVALLLGACSGDGDTRQVPPEDEIVAGRDGGKADRFFWFVDKSQSCSGKCGKIKWSLSGYCGCDKSCSENDDCCQNKVQVCGGYEPCSGKRCGDACTICAPGDPDCFETMELKVCNKDGKCASDAGALTGCGEGQFCGGIANIKCPAGLSCKLDGSTPDAGGTCQKFDPCADKKCGDACTTCAPDDPDCFETMELKACDKDGTCTNKASALTTCSPCQPECTPDKQCVLCWGTWACIPNGAMC